MARLDALQTLQFELQTIKRVAQNMCTVACQHLLERPEQTAIKVSLLWNTWMKALAEGNLWKDPSLQERLPGKPGLPSPQPIAYGESWGCATDRNHSKNGRFRSKSCDALSSGTLGKCWGPFLRE